MNHYLQSDESIFDDIESICDFLEALAIVGFYRVPLKRSNEKRTLIRMRNDSFKSDELPSAELYKRENTNSQMKKSEKKAKKTSRSEKVTKHMPLESIKLIHNLNRKSQRDLKLTSLEFARFQMSFLLASKKGSQEHRIEPDVIDFQLEEPEYMLSGEIAGYYGNASIDELKKAFGKYLPTFSHDSPAEVIDIVAEVVEIDELLDNKKSKPRRKYKSRKSKMTAIAIDEEEDSQSIITETPKRKYTKRGRQILPQETEEAAEFIQKENSEMEKDEILEYLCDLNNGTL